MRAIRTIGPAHGLKGFAGLILVLEDGVLERGGWAWLSSLMAPLSPKRPLLSSI